MSDLPKLGKREPKVDGRTLTLDRYLSLVTLPKPPAHVHPVAAPDWPIYGNDRYGDCVEADMAHAVEAWSAEAGTNQRVTDADVLGAYGAITGWRPDDPSTDQGTYWIDALNYWRQTGIGGHRIDGYMAVNLFSLSPAAARAALVANVKAATWLFGSVQLGLALPLSVQRADRWTVTHGPSSTYGSWGGHAVPVVGYDSQGVTVVTWGRLLRASWAFLGRYVDEAYVALSPDWIVRVTDRSPRGVDVAALQADLAAFG